VKLPYAALTAFVLGATLATSAAYAVERTAEAASGQSTCATFDGVQNVTPGSWNSKTATTYVCTSWPRKCAQGTKPLENTGAVSGPLINSPAQTNYGYKNGSFLYACGVPAGALAPPK